MGVWPTMLPGDEHTRQNVVQRYVVQRYGENVVQRYGDSKLAVRLGLRTFSSILHVVLEWILSLVQILGLQPVITLQRKTIK